MGHLSTYLGVYTDTATCERDLLIPIVSKIEESRGKDATLTENRYEHPSNKCSETQHPIYSRF